MTKNVLLLKASEHQIIKFYYSEESPVQRFVIQIPAVFWGKFVGKSIK